MLITTAIGNLGQDPRIADVNGTPVANFSICSNDRVPGRDEPITTWIDVVAWNGLTNVAKLLKKGEKVAISGNLREKKRHKTSEGFTVIEHVLRAETIELLGRGKRD